MACGWDLLPLARLAIWCINYRTPLGGCNMNYRTTIDDAQWVMHPLKMSKSGIFSHEWCRQILRVYLTWTCKHVTTNVCYESTNTPYGEGNDSSNNCWFLSHRKSLKSNRTETIYQFWRNFAYYKFPGIIILFYLQEYLIIASSINIIHHYIKCRDY